MLRKAIADIQAKYARKDLPDMRAGDTVRVHTKIKEGDKERIQILEGVRDGVPEGTPGSSMFTVRKVSYGRRRRAHVPRAQPGASTRSRCSATARCAAPASLPARPAGQGRSPPPGGGGPEAAAPAAPAAPPLPAPRRSSLRGAHEVRAAVTR